MHVEEAVDLVDDVGRSGASCSRSATRRCCRASGRRATTTWCPVAVTFSTSAAARRGPAGRPSGVMKREPARRRGPGRAARPASAAYSGVVVGPSLTPIGLAIRRDEVDVRAVELAGALADPDEVRRTGRRAAGPSSRSGSARARTRGSAPRGWRRSSTPRSASKSAPQAAHEPHAPGRSRRPAPRSARRPGCATKSWFHACTLSQGGEAAAG